MKDIANIIGLDLEDIAPILDSIGDGIFIDDANGYAIWINRAAEELYRIKREEVIGKHYSYLEAKGVFVPSVAKKVIDKRKKVSILHQNRDGTQLLTTGNPIFDSDGKLSKIITTSHDITELAELQNKLENMQSALKDLKFNDRYQFDDIICNSPAMYNVIKMAERLALVDTTILITGESGSGKGVIANFLHKNGNRRDYPFVKINCGAIPDNLIESELLAMRAEPLLVQKRG